MIIKFLYLVVFGLWIARSACSNTEVSHDKVTDVYRFNTVTADGQGVKYLNTCTAAQVRDTDIGLAKFLVKHPSLTLAGTIPPLYTGLDTTEWQHRFFFSIFPLSVPSYAHRTADFSELPYHSNVSLDTWISYYENEIYKNEFTITEDGYILNENEVKALRSPVPGYNYIIYVKFKKGSSPSKITFENSEGGKISIYMEHDGITYNCKERTIHGRCTHFALKYDTNKDDQFEIVIFVNTDNGDLFFYDKISAQLYDTKIINKDFSTIKHTFVEDTIGDSFTYTYKVVQAAPVTIFSPWFDENHNTTLVIFCERIPGYSLIVYLDEESTYNRIELQTQEIDVIAKPNQLESVLMRVDVEIPETWSNQKRIRVWLSNNFAVRIGNIWEGRDINMVATNVTKTCEKSKLNIMYYDILKRPNTVENGTTCLNGGLQEDSSLCRCPPGFTGNQCEIPCDRNHFGHECSKLCSKSSKECKGMLFCSTYYGCSCGAGYQGENCLQHCEEGFYGADCKQECGKCEYGERCDQYTGFCPGKCSTPYLVKPYCRQSHSYVKEAPEVLDSSFNAVNLRINLTASNIEKSSDNTMFYMVQYRDHMDTTWNDGSYQEFNLTSTNISVDGLKPGRVYYLRVILVDETLETHDPDLTKSTKAQTKCIDYLKVTATTNTSVSLTWNEGTPLGVNECPITISYILEIEETEDGNVETQKILDIKGNFYQIESLTPGQTYAIKLKIMTTYGESEPVSNINVTTDDSIDNSIGIAGVSIEKTDAQVKIKWFESLLYKTYYIKYKLIRRLACNKDERESPLRVITTTDTTCTLSSLEPNAKYELFVTADKNENGNKNTLTFITRGKIPNTSPALVTQKVKVTNESAKIYWTNVSSSCQHMNGIFNKYTVELYDTHNENIFTYETKENRLELTGLRPQTPYIVKVRFVNHVGSNPNNYMEYNFTTKPTPVLQIQELTAYKTSSDVIGLRWKIPDTNVTFTTMHIHIKSDTWNKTIDIPFSEQGSFQCKPWPSYVCLDVTELKQNTKYAIMVNISNEEFPEGTQSRGIHVITRETMPSAVSDIKMSRNKTLSWRIPDLLNGILRKFVIEVEHFSSFDDTLCCQNIVVIDYTVTSEQAIYSHTLQDFYNASSYKITIRPFTKRLGREASRIFTTPPPRIPIKNMPRVYLNGVEVTWPAEDKGAESSATYSELASDVLIIVQELNQDTHVTSEVLGFRDDINHILNSNNWWVTQVCAAHDDNCSVYIGAEEGEDHEVPDYGQVFNKPLIVGNVYRIVVVQVNKYLTARSYTRALQESFVY
ncbi:hypothetical protein M8J77_018488 [Diaphorina citri]|nr:hypothetical protein M8J77_018488 [Diaphorina citri]